MSAYKEAGVDIEKAEEIVRYLGMSGYGSVITVSYTHLRAHETLR